MKGDRVKTSAAKRVMSMPKTSLAKTQEAEVALQNAYSEILNHIGEDPEIGRASCRERV